MSATDFNFFTAQPFYDGQAGFGIFSPTHILFLLCSIALIAILVHAFVSLPRGLAWGSPRRTMLLVVAIIPLIMVTSNDCIMAKAGVFGAQWWPLHTCNFCEYLLLIYALKPNRFAGEVECTLGVVGALSALLFPNWYYCPALCWPTFCGFTEHTLIIAFPLMLMLGGEFKPSWKHITDPLIFLAVYVPFFYVFNKSHDTNFLFLNTPSPGSPMVPVADALGSPGYLVPFFAVLIASWVGLYALWGLLAKHDVPGKLQRRAERRHADKETTCR